MLCNVTRNGLRFGRLTFDSPPKASLNAQHTGSFTGALTLPALTNLLLNPAVVSAWYVDTNMSAAGAATITDDLSQPGLKLYVTAAGDVIPAGGGHYLTAEQYFGSLEGPGTSWAACEGDVLTFSARCRLQQSLPAGVEANVGVGFEMWYDDGTVETASVAFGVTSSSWANYSGTYTVPAAAAGKKFGGVTIRVFMLILNHNGSPYTVTSGALPVAFSFSECSFTNSVAQQIGAMDEIQLLDASDNPLWGGFITQYTVSDAKEANRLRASFTCVDYRLLLQTSIVTKDYTGLGMSDQAIIQDAFTVAGMTAISALTADVSLLIASLDINVPGMTLAAMLDELSKAAGGIWYVTADKRLIYCLPTVLAAAAPFSLDADAPNGTTSFGFKLGQAWSETFYNPANDVTVYGGIDTGDGSPIIEHVTDPTSIALYGTFKSIIRDNTISSPSQALAVANAQLAQNKNPQQTYSVTCWHVDPTLQVGQLLSISHKKLGWSSKPLVIQQISYTKTNQAAPKETQVDIALGDYRLDLKQIIKNNATTTIKNPVFDPVIPYKPIGLPATVAFSLTGTGTLTNILSLGGGAFAGDLNSAATLLFSVSSQGGKLLRIALKPLQELYPAIDAGPATSGARPYVLQVGINMDGQGEQLFNLINSETPTWGTAPGTGHPNGTISNRANWSTDLSALFTPGASVGADVEPLHPLTMDFAGGLEYVTSLEINLYYSITGLTTNSGHAAAVGATGTVGTTNPTTLGQFAVSLFYAQKYPAP